MVPACWPEYPHKFVSGGVVHQSCMTIGIVHLSVTWVPLGCLQHSLLPSRDDERFQS